MLNQVYDVIKYLLNINISDCNIINSISTLYILIQTQNLTGFLFRKQTQMNPELTQSKNSKGVDDQIGFDKVFPFELIYQDVQVYATIEAQFQTEGGKTEKRKIEKNILKKATGKFEPYTFTAILGPSGSGKTTLLNLLSGRLLSENLRIHGKLKVNGNQTDNINEYKNYLGYVMQEDYMLPTFTPFEAFKFIADIRLSKKTEEQKVDIVNKVIEFLGLGRCRDTYIGDNRIRGVSGGQKKRTSIGLQLLINPSIIFLDEPTTGLDSTTALNLITFLNNLAKTGRTVVSTIHQPSSQIFAEFDKMVLVVDGNVVYHGGARESTHYFAGLGLPVPAHSNPTDFYMKVMNKQGIMLNYIEQQKEYTDEQVAREFEERVTHLVTSYQSVAHDIQNKYIDQIKASAHDYHSSWLTQYLCILRRNWINQFRQPLDVILKVVQSIFFAVIAIILYVDKASDQISYLQNFRGVLFFLTMNAGFSYVFSSVNLFNFQRPIFIRQRLSNTYETSAYFWGRSTAVLPVEIITPLLFLTICYFVVNLHNTFEAWLFAAIAIEGIAWMSSSYGLVLSTLFKDASVVMALVPALIIPLLLVGGFFAPLNQVNDFYRVFEYISMFKYGFQSMVQSQFTDGFLYINGVTPSTLTQQSEFDFEEPYWLSIMLMFLIGIVLRGLSLFLMWYISNPKLMKLSPAQPQVETPQRSNQNSKYKQTRKS